MLKQIKKGKNKYLLMILFLIMLIQDIDNDGFYRMTKIELPLKSSNKNEDITHQLNNHKFVSTCYLIKNCLFYKL